MNAIDRLSHVLTWLCAELLNAILRPLWRRSLAEFEMTVNALDCYPCRVCWDTGPFPQMWIETGARDASVGFEEDFQ
ncbi:MAG: hypothetical protein JSR30_00315 [Proteobacteria bacterium]|nr:hypothetical protein [Pseudomonadota bacterium]